MAISRLRIGEISRPELGQGLVPFHAHKLMGSGAQELVGFIPFQTWKYTQTFYPTISWQTPALMIQFCHRETAGRVAFFH